MNRACEGAATKSIRTTEHMEQCRACKVAVRFDMVAHPFWGFKSSCSKPHQKQQDTDQHAEGQSMSKILTKTEAIEARGSRGLLATAVLYNSHELLRAQVEALTAENQTRQWQPISTGPKNGRCVLLWWPQVHRGVTTGRFMSGRWESPLEQQNWVQGIPDCPTHWMPLPTPPEGATS